MHRIGLATACLHISAVLYILFGALFFVGMLLAPADPELPEWFLTVCISGMLLLCIALAVGLEFVAAGLRRRRFWAWVAGLCIFGLYLPSLFLPLGALGLWGLLAEGSRREFGISVGSPPS